LTARIVPPRSSAIFAPFAVAILNHADYMTGQKPLIDGGMVGDKGAADLFTGVSRQIDKDLWLKEAHLR
jgi:hypothetical protein